MRSLVFRVRRKRFSIETFTLPPEEDQEEVSPSSFQNAQHSNEEHMRTLSGQLGGLKLQGCGVTQRGGNKALDF